MGYETKHVEIRVHDNDEAWGKFAQIINFEGTDLTLESVDADVKDILSAQIPDDPRKPPLLEEIAEKERICLRILYLGRFMDEGPGMVWAAHQHLMVDVVRLIDGVDVQISEYLQEDGTLAPLHEIILEGIRPRPLTLYHFIVLAGGQKYGVSTL